MSRLGAALAGVSPQFTQVDLFAVGSGEPGFKSVPPIARYQKAEKSDMREMLGVSEIIEMRDGRELGGVGRNRRVSYPRVTWKGGSKRLGGTSP